MDWNEPEAMYSGVLEIGDLSFPCSVLSDQSRILTTTDFMHGMGMYYSGWVAKHGPAELPHFLSFKSLKPFIDKHLGALQSITMKYRTERGNLADGIKAETIPKICNVWIDANAHGNLGSRQKQIAAKALTVLQGLAYVGIIALVDEATGYQDVRDRDALHKILDNYLLPERAKWAKRFPDEFYMEIFRLRGWPWRGMKVNRPSVVGTFTNDVVWDRLEKYIHEELRRRNPRTESGYRRTKHHQWLTDDIGHPKLQTHLIGVMALMRASSNWGNFYRALQRAYPKFGETIPMDLNDPTLSPQGAKNAK